MAKTDLCVFQQVRRVSAPLVWVNTPDPNEVVASLVESLGDSEVYRGMMVGWDIASGMSCPPGDEAAKAFISKYGGGTPDDQTVGNPAEMLRIAKTLPPGSMLFMQGADRWANNDVAVQAIANLRDLFKVDRRTLVLLSIGGTIPPEIAQDVVIIDDPLPSAAKVREIILRVYKDAEIDTSSGQHDADIANLVSALLGLTAFQVEQTTAMCLRRSGIDIDLAWSSKVKLVSQTPGLAIVDAPEETFDSIGGCCHVKTFLERIMQGPGKPGAVVWIDEIEKALSGATGPVGDTSGTSQDQLGVLLTWMQDSKARGVIFVGPPGTAKSAVCRAYGNVIGRPTISFDLGGMKASLVGQSEQRIRSALKVVNAIADGSPLVMATCNRIATLPPELRRRFTLGTWFFDLPTEEERRLIWDIWMRKYDLCEQPLPVDTDWTGAEIRACCDLAYIQQVSLLEAATNVVPVAVAAADAVEALRQQASGRYLSASYPGKYQHRVDTQSNAGGKRRSLAMTM